MTSATKPPAACLIGWPAAHSRSPLIHHYWLRTLGIAGGYVIEAVPPDEFKDFIFRLSLRGFVGANVTIPHKERALSLSKPDERARAVGAANTLWFENGELLLDQHRRRRLYQQSRRLRDPAGTGAKMRWCSAPAVRRARWCSACSTAASSACISPTAPWSAPARWRISSARAFCRWRGMRSAISCRAPGCLVNTTSLGMKGQPPLELDVGRLPSHAVVADLVYVPLDTPLLAASRARGLKTADGLGMLLHQAVRGFELWFGRRPEVTAELRALVEADLTNT